MSSLDKSPKNLIDDIISYLKKERELYGDFALKNNDNYSESDSNNPSASENLVAEPSTQNNSEKISAPSASVNDQEGLFNQDDTNTIYQKIGECNSLEELEALCSTADVLKTDLKETKLVFGVGNPNADLVLIGEAPGAEEDKQGEPFVGRAGQLLNKILDAISFDREDIYITNILKYRPPNNRNPKPEERERSLPFLMRQIDLINPKLILCLGKISAQTLLKKNTSLSKMRGQFHTFHNKYQLLATYHPAALLRNTKWKRPTWEDMQLLRKRYDELSGQP